MKLQNRKNTKKGFVKVIESIFAAILLIGYTSSFFSLEPVQEDWQRISAKQQGQEYIAAFGKTPLQQVVIQNKKSEFLDITQYFLGSGKGYSLETNNIVDPSIRIAVLVTNTTSNLPTIEATSEQTPCTSMNANACFAFSFRSTNMVAVSNVTLPEREYVSVYKQNGAGPYYTTDLIQLGNGEFWQLENTIYESGKLNITFLNASSVNPLKKAMDPDYRSVPVTINGRSIEADVKAVLVTDKLLSNYDMVVVPDTYTMDSTAKTILLSLLRKGANILFIVSSDTVLTQELFDTTNTKSVTYARVNSPIIQNSTSPQIPFESNFFETPRYFTSAGFDIDTTGTGHQGSVTLGQTTYPVSVAPASGSTVYDRVNVSTHQNKRVGDAISLEGNAYIIGDINPDGRFVTLLPSRTHIFVEYQLPDKIVSAEDNTDAIILTAQSGDYAALGEPETMSVGQVYTDTDQQFAQVSYTINMDPFSPSITYNTVIYPNDADIQIGPDHFTFHIIDDDSVEWKLMSRSRIPNALSYEGFTGTTIMLPKADSDDEWGYVRAIAFQLLKGNAEFIRNTQGKKGSLSVSDTFITSNSFYQAYEVIFRLWY